MDPLSITVSGLTILKLCAETVEYLQKVKGSSKECNRLKAEIRSTEAILKTFTETVQDPELEQGDWEVTLRSVTSKSGPLEQLEHAVKSLHKKLACAAPAGGMKGLGKCLLWPFKSAEMQEILKTIDRQKSLLLLALENDHFTLSKEIRDNTRTLLVDMNTVKESVQQISERHDEQDRQAIVDWIPAIDYTTQQSDFISRRQEGTGQWLLSSDEFNNWIERSGQTLFCPGMPGAGKTIITSIVVDNLRHVFQLQPTVGIACVYFDSQRQHEQTPIDFLLSILKQLLQGPLAIPDVVGETYARCKGRRTPLSLDDSLRMLYSAFAEFSRTFIIVDALDEVSDNHTTSVLTALFNLQTKTGASIFATSRFIPKIERTFETGLTVEIRASNADVLRYLEGHMSLLPTFVSRNSDLQAEIKSMIIQAVNGMFLLAQLHLGSLVGKRSPKAVRVALARLPTGSDGYDHAYKEVMERVKGQPLDSYELAKQVLSWISCAKRPLTTTELCHALAVEMGEHELDEENLPDLEDMVSVCAGLVTVDRMSDTVRLVHYTAQEYFERTWNFWFPEAPENIAIVCVTYISFNSFDTGPCMTDEEFESRLRMNTLYDYAARNWGHHARTAFTEAEELILDLLRNENKVSASSQVLLAPQNVSGYSQRVPRKITGLHLAAYFGLSQAMTALLGFGLLPSLANSYGQTPLWWAAQNGHEAVVKLLLSFSQVDINAKDSEYGQTPLWWAVSNGHDSVVKLLLEKREVDVNSTDIEYGRTPLSWAARNGHDGVVKLLLGKDGINVNSRDRLYSDTPLSWAAKNGHEEVVELLLSHRAIDFNCKDTEYEQTPLSWAARNAHEGVVQILLRKEGVDINRRDKAGATPLIWAARKGNTDIVRLLLEQDGIQLDAKDAYGQAPLDWAWGGGHEATVRAIMEKEGIDTGYSPLDTGEVALMQAARLGDVAAVKLLLEKRAIDVNFKDKQSWSSLLWAARNGHDATVRHLLSQPGIDVNIKDIYSQTPLWWAAREGHTAVAKLLLDRTDIDVNAGIANPIDSGETALSQASRSGHRAVVRLLLEKQGVNVNSKDCYYRTPVLWAAREGHDSVLKMLLLREDLDVNSRDKYGRTPLAWAAREGNEVAARLLLAHKAVDKDAEDSYGRKPISWAEEHGHRAIARLLRTG